MDIWILAVIFIAALLLGGAIVFIIIKYTTKTKNDNETDRHVSANTKNRPDIDQQDDTELGPCNITGIEDEFYILFSDRSIGFLVKNGIITEHKMKGNAGYKKY